MSAVWHSAGVPSAVSAVPGVWQVPDRSPHGDTQMADIRRAHVTEHAHGSAQRGRDTTDKPWIMESPYPGSGTSFIKSKGQPQTATVDFQALFLGPADNAATTPQPGISLARTRETASYWAPSLVSMMNTLSCFLVG